MAEKRKTKRMYETQKETLRAEKEAESEKKKSIVGKSENKSRKQKNRA